MKLTTKLCCMAVCVTAAVPVDAAPYPWINFSRGQAQPSNLTLTETAVLNPASDPALAIRLVDNTPGVAGRAIITPPAEVPSHGFKFFEASFTALMIFGTGADGFSFNYGPNENLYNNGAYEDGTSLGLGISFDCRRDAGRFPDQCNIYYNGALLRSYGLDLWDADFSNQNLQMAISYAPNGLTVIVRTRQWYNGAILINDIVASDLPINGWNPQSNWKFFFASRNGAANMRTAVSDLLMTTDTDRPLITVTDKSTSEDIPLNTTFTVRDVDTSLANVTVTASSANTTLVPNSSITVGGAGSTRFLTITPTPHEFGTSTITLQANDGASTTTSTFQLTVAPVNDRPVSDSRGVLRFDEVDDAFLANVSGLTGGNAPHSVEVWLRPFPPVSSGISRSVLELGSAVGFHSWTIHQVPNSSTHVRLQCGPNQRSPQITDIQVPLSRWSHIAAVWDGTNYSVYLNGLLAGQAQPAGGFNIDGLAPRLFTGFFTPIPHVAPQGELDELRVWNRALSDIEIRRGLQIPLAGNENGLVGYWRFDEIDNVVAFDSATAGGRSNGSLLSGARFGLRRDETGLFLDGVDDVVHVSHHALLNTFPLTVTAWIKTTDDDGAVVNKYFVGSLNGYQIYLGGGRLFAWYFRSTLDYIWDGGAGLDGGVINDGQWHHVAFTVGAAGGSLYVDGNLVATRSWSGTPGPPTTTAPLLLGNYNGTAAYLGGGVDEVTVWNRVLSSDEVQAARYATFTGTETGLIAYYPLAETSGAIAFDQASADGNNHGTLEGGPARGIADPSPVFGTWAVNEETPTEIFLPGLDVELYRGEAGAALTYTILSPPSHGSVNFTSGNWSLATRNPITYTPATDYTGPDSLTYRLTDEGSGQSQVATVFIQVAALNDNPLISEIPNLVIEEGTDTGEIPFTISDAESPTSQLQLTATSSDTRLVPTANIVFGGEGTNRTVRVAPAPSEVGTATIEITVTDPQFGLSTETFRLRVEPQPAYALVDLGALGLRNSSFGAGINTAGWAVGRAERQTNEGHALLNRGLSGIGPEDINRSSDYASEAYAINNQNLITGFLRPASTNPREAFLWAGGAATSLSSMLVGGNDSVGYAISDTADIAGSFHLISGGQRRAFRLLSDGLGGYTFTNLGVLPGGTVSEAFGVNNALQVVGYSTITGGADRAFLHEGASMVDLGVLPGDFSSRAFGVNDDGQAVGYSQASSQPNSPRRAFVHNGGGMIDLGLLTNGNSSEAYAINAFGQVVGTADRRLSAQTTEQRAFLHTSGRMRDLNDLVRDSRDFVFGSSNWKLQEARAINVNGAIVGTGLKDGIKRAFLAVPAWVIGRQIARPEGAVERLPEIEILSGGPSDTALNAFHWSDYEKKLYAIRPVTARLRWFTSFTDVSGTGSNVTVNTSRITVEGMSVWPQRPIVHVLNVPVQAEPQGVPFNYSFQSIMFDATSGGTTFEPTAKTFNCNRAGYSVLYYLKTDGTAPNPQTQSPHFDVVRTYDWLNAPTFKDNVSAVVGQTLADPDHNEYLDRNGYVFFPNAFYDGAGPDRAHDRAGRRGPIIPVNLDSPGNGLDDLLVVWYRFNTIGVAWASVPVRYSVRWPADAVVEKIIIASQLGSGALPSTQFPNKQVYNQPEATLPGYNPNEEHAFIADDKLFALRNDLNDNVTPKASDPYALLKYRDPITAQWSMRVYKVVGEEAPYFFRYGGIAGTEIQPPLPLSALPLCSQSHGLTGPWWEDWQGKLYARAAGTRGETANIIVRWFYPLQAGFFYDLNRDGTNDVAAGTCVAWLDRRNVGELSPPNQSAGISGIPLDITYLVRWPETPILQIGETLLDSKRGLPAVKDRASLQLIYDDLTPTWNPLVDANPPLDTLARLYDPLSTRTYALAAGESIPSVIPRTNRAGKEEFNDLPPAIKSRLRYDPINRWLLFSGILDDTVVGEPLLLPNVLTSRERDRIKALDPGNASWAAIVNKLYDRTRNPNQVDLQPRDGQPDSANDSVTSTNSNPGLRLGLTTQGTTVVVERFGSLPKALTSAIGGVPPAAHEPGNALTLTGAITADINIPAIDLFTEQMTIELWVKSTNLAGQAVRTLVRQGEDDPDWALDFRNNGTALAFTLRAGGTETLLTVSVSPADFDGRWRHIAATYDGAQMRLLVDGRQQAETPKIGAIQLTPGRAHLGVKEIGGTRSDPFAGLLDEIRFWNVGLGAFQLDRDRDKWLSGAEDGLVRYYRCDEIGFSLTDGTGGAQHGSLSGGVSFIASTAPTGARPRYLTLVENNDPALAGLPIQLHIIRVEDGPLRGDLKVLPSENVFDQRLTLRHSSEFGGDPDPLQFEWYYQPDSAGFNPTELPLVSINGVITDARGWTLYTRGNRNLNAPPPPVLTSELQGVNDITIGEGGESGLLSMSDNWFICRYRGYNVRGNTNWSDWVGDPAAAGESRAMLAEGWIKRVIRGLNAFDQRVTDFHSAPVNTFASMLVQAGARYEGDIAFNDSADNLNSIGLIEAYTTVLNRGRSLSIDGTPQVDFNPANNALLLVASRVSDFYVLLGNEAYADAQDPTIGFGTSSLEYGTAASSIFAFQNQLDSLLEEELVLLRGRDDRNAGVGGRPVYNRLFWNFTTGEGEVAYQQAYNISDQDFDGDVDEFDARILFPQGHGDAWGHYLTATKVYYDLLRHSFYTHIPRTERVLVAGAPVEVDFLDERKFAKAAASKARAAREIVDLTYRLNYVEDPAGQWQGYKDRSTDRAWGVDEWARRAAQGAYFDWLTANAILPDVDPNTNHIGIQKIDRTTVLELGEIAAAADTIQATMTEADTGLNPLGIAKGAVPFDIDPSEIALEGLLFGRTHYEQIRDRAHKALNNAVSVFNEANRATQLLRQNQDGIDDLTRNVRQQELDFKNRLIEIYGYPYAGDIGPGKPYPSGYDGADLYKFMYVDVTEITGERFPPRANYTNYFKPSGTGGGSFTFYNGDRQESVTNTQTLETDVLTIEYPVSAADYGFQATTAMGRRRAPGEIQFALQDIVLANADLKIALQAYNNFLQQLRDAFQNLQARRELQATNFSILDRQKGQVIGINAGLGIAKAVELTSRRLSAVAGDATDITVESFPRSVGLANDVTSFARGIAKALGGALGHVVDIAGDAAELSREALSLSKEQVALQTQLDVLVESQEFEIIQAVNDLESLVRNEPALRTQVGSQVEQIRQLVGRYQALLAEGARVQEQLLNFRRNTAADVTEARYSDMTFRIFRNDALRKYRAQFDVAARYVYLAATAYDYDSNLLGTDNRAGRNFLADIVRQRALGQVVDGEPILGQPGLADPLGRLNANYEVIKTQFGLNNPAVETTRFSLRHELFRMKDDDPEDPDDASDDEWRKVLNNRANTAGYQALRVDNLWNVPEFRRFCRPFAPEFAGPQPGLIIRFPTTVTFGLNFFLKQLGGGDSSYDSSRFATRVRSAGIWFQNYDGHGLSQTPRVYFVPAGLDVLRSPNADDFATREWRVIDQALPVPFPIGGSTLRDPLYIPQVDSLGGTYAAVRRHPSMRAYHDDGFVEPDALTTDTRLIGRSVWNTDWLMIIPGGTFLFDAEQGLDTFINSNTDILFLLQSYSYAGN